MIIWNEFHLRQSNCTSDLGVALALSGHSNQVCSYYRLTAVITAAQKISDDKPMLF